MCKSAILFLDKDVAYCYILEIKEKYGDGQVFEEKLKQIGARIVYYRKMKRMNQQDFASAAGLTRQFLSKVENGDATCSLSTLFHIAEVLNVDMADLVKD